MQITNSAGGSQMNIHGINKRLQTLTLATMALTVPSLCGAFTATPIIFDPDGNGGNFGDLQDILSFDWFVDSALITDVPEPPPLFPPDTTKSVQALAHGKLATLGLENGPAPALDGLNVTFEITYAAAFGEKGTSNAAGDVVTFVQDSDLGFNNVFTIYYDDWNPTDGGVKASTLSGLGFTDGHPILTGHIVSLPDGNFARGSDDIVDLDKSGFNNYPGIMTIQGTGAQTIVVQVTSFDDAFFKNLSVGTLIEFTNESKLAFVQNNPSANFEVPGDATVTANVGGINGATGPDMLLQIDPSNSYEIIPTAYSCRVTGGGNDTAGMYTDPATGESIGWDYTYGSGAFTTTTTTTKVKGNSGKVETITTEGTNVYTFGGQAGANTGKQPQPKGELEHVNHSGPSGQWSFHMGTASAPPGTEVDIIQCSDPGWCRQARPAPTKQIDFAGIGTFKNIISEGELVTGACAQVAKTTGKPSERTVGTYNWAEVHIEDRGEPGREGQHTDVSILDPEQCPPQGTGTDAFSAYDGIPLGESRVGAVADGTYIPFSCKTDNDPSTDCPDFYRIRIYCGLEPTFDEDGNLTNFNEIAAQKYNAGLIYEVYGYIDGGNWQIHPPTGFDLR